MIKENKTSCHVTLNSDNTSKYLGTSKSICCSLTSLLHYWLFLQQYFQQTSQMMPAEALSFRMSLGFSPLCLVCQADTPFLRGPPAFPTFLSLLSDSLSGGELSPQLLGKCHTGPCCSRGAGGRNGVGGVGGNNNIFYCPRCVSYSRLCSESATSRGTNSNSSSNSHR